MTSKIEWTEKTWNPIIGCSKTSEGCANCYAETMAARLASMGTEGYPEVMTDRKWNGNTALVESALNKPLKRKKPTVYFVGSMTDLFHKSVKNYWLDEIFAVMGSCPQHRFILLTKRPERMQEYCSSRREEMRQNYVYRQSFQVLKAAEEKGVDLPLWPLPNVILGVTAENQEQADQRIPVLLDTPAAARFVSVEPMLGPVDLTAIMGNRFGEIWNTLDTEWDENACKNGPALDWVICGGESGSGARFMHPDWARYLRDQCAAAGKPFFFKQWGEWAEGQPKHFENRKCWGDGKVALIRMGKKTAGNLLDGQAYKEYPANLREVQNA